VISSNNLYSLTVFIKLVFLILPIVFLTVLFLINSKKRKVKKLGRLIQNDEAFANEFASNLNIEICEIECETNLVEKKLIGIKPPLNISNHLIYVCHQLNESTFIIITYGKYKFTPKVNSEVVDMIMYFNYHLDRLNNKLIIYSNSDKNPNATDIKKSFTNNFFENHISVDFASD